MSAPATAIAPLPVLLVPPRTWLGLWCGIAAATLFAGKAVLVRYGYHAGAGTTDLLALRMAKG